MGVTVSGVERAQYAAAIDRLGGSRVLHGSESLCRLLRYLAEQRLQNPGSPIKEYQIAAEVFGRPSDFDPHVDSSIRVQAGRLRLKLAEYYSSEGERDPIKLAKLRDKRCLRSETEIALALEGTWRPEHLFELRQAYELYQFHHRQISECDKQVEAELANFPNRAGQKTRVVKPRKRGRKSNDVRFEAAGPLFQALGVDLTLIEGIDVGTALVILGEIGVDVSRFPTEKHFASWLRLCPPQDESNQTKKRRGHRKGTNRVTIALRMCARSVGKAMTPLGLFYRRIRSRIGGLGAVKATAHKLARLVYRMLKYGQEYVTQSLEEYEAKVQANILKSLKRKAAALGFQLSPMPTQQ
jgi:transposase